MELCGNDEDFHRDLICERHADVLGRRDDVPGDGHRRRREDHAHLLKGALQVPGEERASKSAHDLEQAIRAGEPDGELTRRLNGELDRIARSPGDVVASSARRARCPGERNSSKADTHPGRSPKLPGMSHSGS